MTSYLHMGARVTTTGRANKGNKEKVRWLLADRDRPLFLFHLEPFLSRTRGGLAGLEAGLRGGLLWGGE